MFRYFIRKKVSDIFRKKSFRYFSGKFLIFYSKKKVLNILCFFTLFCISNTFSDEHFETIFPKKSGTFFRKTSELFPEKIEIFFSEKIRNFFPQKLTETFFSRKTPELFLSEIETFSLKNRELFSGKKKSLIFSRKNIKNFFFKKKKFNTDSTS